MSAKISRGSSHLGVAAPHFRPSSEATRGYVVPFRNTPCVITGHSNLTQQGMSQGGSISIALTDEDANDKREMLASRRLWAPKPVAGTFTSVTNPRRAGRRLISDAYSGNDDDYPMQQLRRRIQTL